MKKKTKKAHAQTKRKSTPPSLQKTAVRQTFTPEETGQPDPTPMPDLDNPRGVQSGRGPTNQEGEGERQNAELAELNQVEPDIDLDKR